MTNNAVTLNRCHKVLKKMTGALNAVPKLRHHIQGPDMGKCRPGARRKVPPPNTELILKMPLPPPGVNIENFTAVKFRDILLTGTGQTFKPGQSRPNRDVWQVQP